MKFIFTDMEMITEISYSKSLDTVKGQPDISACMIHIRDDNNYPYNDFDFVGNEIEILGSYSNRCSKLVNSLYEPSDPKGIILLSKMIRNISFIVMGVRRIKLISDINPKKTKNKTRYESFIDFISRVLHGKVVKSDFGRKAGKKEIDLINFTALDNDIAGDESLIEDFLSDIKDVFRRNKIDDLINKNKEMNILFHISCYDDSNPNEKPGINIIINNKIHDSLKESYRITISKEDSETVSMECTKYRYTQYFSCFNRNHKIYYKTYHVTGYNMITSIRTPIIEDYSKISLIQKAPYGYEVILQEINSNVKDNQYEYHNILESPIDVMKMMINKNENFCLHYNVSGAMCSYYSDVNNYGYAYEMKTCEYTWNDDLKIHYISEDSAITMGGHSLNEESYSMDNDKPIDPNSVYGKGLGFIIEPGNIATLEKLSKDIRRFFGLEDDDEDVSVQPIMKEDSTKAVIKTYHYNIKDIYEF